MQNWKQKKKLIVKNPEEDDAELRTMSDFITAQTEDAFSQQSRRLVGTSSSSFTFDKNGVLIGQELIDGSIKNLCPHQWVDDCYIRHILEQYQKLPVNEGCMISIEKTNIAQT